MVLNQLKGRLKTARRGHKLLKDKRDELMRQFMDVVKLNKQLRTRVEEGLTGAFASLQVASSIMSPEMLEQALLYPRQSVELGMDFKNIMSVNVPVYSFHTKNNDPSEVYPYGFAQTSGELDDALEKMAKVFEDMLELAQVEKTMQLLAEEIEKTRRRVNALEYVMIPELEGNIKYISMKLEENENSTKVRLLKVKEMVLQDAHNFKLNNKTSLPAGRFYYVICQCSHGREPPFRERREKRGRSFERRFRRSYSSYVRITLSAAFRSLVQLSMAERSRKRCASSSLILKRDISSSFARLMSRASSSFPRRASASPRVSRSLVHAASSCGSVAGSSARVQQNTPESMYALLSAASGHMSRTARKPLR